MLKCLFCEAEIDPVSTKPEHILLNGLGGRKTTRSVICSSHNGDFGSSIDRALLESVHRIRNMFQLAKGDRSEAPGAYRVPAGEELINIYGDGRMSLAGKPFEIVDLGEGKIRIQVNVDSPEDIVKYIPGIASKLGKPVSEVREAFETAEITTRIRRPGVSYLALQFGGVDAVRSIVKACLVLWAELLGTDELRREPYEAARRFVLQGGDHLRMEGTEIDSRPLQIEESLASRFGPMFNFIYVRSDAMGQVTAHFTLYNIIAWRVILAKSGGAPHQAIGLASNPLEPGARSEEVATEHELAFDWLSTPIEDPRMTTERLAKLNGVYAQRAIPRLAYQMLNEVLREQGFGGNAVPDERTYQEICWEAARRTAALLLDQSVEQRLTEDQVRALFGGKGSDPTSR